jgi:hypothetical protein
MNRTDEEVEAEVSRQERQAAESAELGAQIQEYNIEFEKGNGWTWVDGCESSYLYYWAHTCGEEYYQFDCPEKCYLGCEGEE